MTEVKTNKDRYAVFGNPIAQSKSPQIHALFAEQTEQSMEYGKQCVAEDKFNEAADKFFESGGKGLNITAPFKYDAFKYASQLTDSAAAAEAVNTLALQADGSLLGDNTDGHGLVSDIAERLAWPLENKKILVLGAGGAVRGVLLPILLRRPSLIVIANRTPAKAEALAKNFTEQGNIRGCGFADLDETFDLVINGTSATLAGDLPPVPATVFSQETRVYDMVYGSEQTLFLRWAMAQGAGAGADGLGMLVGQAAKSFALWRGVLPDVTPVMASLRP